ncbi:hypothetical protein [Methylobacterium nodulans]|uniref:hypothetical protein n=1 Tax=Methylobacterium nodulans TaxID=114616 RepID=UPI0012ECE864|nr:hypothetical protein [Methylobacterium nodulans]
MRLKRVCSTKTPEERRAELADFLAKAESGQIIPRDSSERALIRMQAYLAQWEIKKIDDEIANKKEQDAAFTSCPGGLSRDTTWPTPSTSPQQPAQDPIRPR